ncbi:glycoside hydrolase family 15 protein [Halobaculum gomorrense]|uniref:Glucan 1,4-alpha-glucosidase n=1 Tax=Halobaculum gomorrense TaxID=43928 RepID=A0A1M5NPY6_9EURY|nr:glycoside hydrolase family 15 protein [Halobaculum gomorrense]SHG91259.1 glucan 1,4-alpha-glucosidase [Halobaculum gomorrense]
MSRRDTNTEGEDGPDSGRRRYLAAAAGTGLVGLAGCGGTGDDADAGGGSADGTGTEADESPDTTAATPADPGEVELAPFWTTGEKVGIGTAVGDGSGDARSAREGDGRVWYTLTRGALTGVRFPRVDLLNVRRFDFLVADGQGYAARTADLDRRDDDDVERTVEPTAGDALCYRHEFSSASRGWTLSVEYVADPKRDAVLADVSFDPSGGDGGAGGGSGEGSDDGPDPGELSVYAVCRPAVTTGTEGDAHARATAGGDPVLTATDGGDGGVIRDADGGDYDISLALAADPGFEWATAAGVPDESTARLLTRGVEGDRSREAKGNAALVGRLATGPAETTLALGFAEGSDPSAAAATAHQSLSTGFSAARTTYRAGWRAWLAGVDVPDSVAGDEALAALYRTSAMVIRAAEDATVAGAGVASPCVPWGGVIGAGEPADVGYHYVWARDLYQSFTALEAMGRTESAVAAAEYLFAVQQREGGFLPQNTYVDGRTRWGGEQLDEIAFPLVLARRATAEHGRRLADLAFGYADVAASADYVLRSGPGTGQERWEEESGLSPSTIAAEVAGLVSAAAVAGDAGRDDAAGDGREPAADALVWLATADRFRAGVREWCVTREGTDHHDPPYYFRINGNRDPDDGTERTLANGGRTFDERNVIDAGFLELVRLGVLPADDPVIESSVGVVDDDIRVETPHGPAFHRYTGDGYGEDEDGAPFPVATESRGRLWPLLTGERAEYELAAGTTDGPTAPADLLATLAGFANEGRLLPEQVWDRAEPTAYGWRFGEGTGSATPLSWSHAAFVRLAHGIDASRPVGTPAVVGERYDGGPPSSPSLDVAMPDPTVEADAVTVAGKTDAPAVAVAVGGDARLVSVEDGRFEATVELSSGRNTLVVAAGDPEEPAATAPVTGERTVVSSV